MFLKKIAEIGVTKMSHFSNWTWMNVIGLDYTDLKV